MANEAPIALKACNSRGSQKERKMCINILCDIHAIHNHEALPRQNELILWSQIRLSTTQVIQTLVPK